MMLVSSRILPILECLIGLKYVAFGRILLMMIAIVWRDVASIIAGFLLLFAVYRHELLNEHVREA